MKIIPAILAKSETEFLQQAQAIESATDCIHIDITDGKFVPETTWADPGSVSNNLKTDCELHLMVKNPLEVIESWKNIPQVKRVLFHAESTDSLSDVIQTIHGQDWEAFAVLNPETPVSMIQDEAKNLDGVMIMTIHPGAQGRSFMSEMLEKFVTIKNQYPHLITQVDGGANADTLLAIKSAGVDCACVGSAIFAHGNPAENLKKLETLIA